MGKLQGLGLTIVGVVALLVLLLHTASAQVPISSSIEDQPGVDWFSPSLALDSQGTPHISFWARNVGSDLRYASWDEGAQEWSSEIVDDSREVGQFTSLAIDADDHPHISYYDLFTGDLKYAYWDGALWITHTVDITGDVGSDCTSLALDAQGVPHISYYDATSGTLKFTYWDAGQGQWQIQIVDDGGVGAYSSLQLDSAGDAHISYYSELNRNLKYARGQWDGSAWLWDIQTLDEPGRVGMYTSLALDASDQPRISYYDASNGDLKYASWNPGSSAWDIEVVDSGGVGGDVGRFSSLVLDTSGFPHIGYHDSTNERLRYARWDGSQWISETVDTTVAVLGAVSLKLDADDQPRIAYGEKVNSDLRYAFWDPLQQAWVIQTVYTEEEAGVGYYNSLELDSTLSAHIAYYDKGDRDLEYAHRYWDGSRWAWDIQTLDSEGRTGRYCSLELDADDYPRIGYVDSLELELSYAIWDGTQWTIEVVPNDEGMGRYSSMVLDGNDYPHFASYGQDIRGLAYAYWDGTQWHSEAVDTAGDTGWSSSIAVDAAGQPHISYTCADSQTLRYAHWDGSQWISQTVATLGPEDTAYRMETSIALDADGRPCISYYDSTDSNLMYASWDGTAWITQTVDDGRKVGTRSSLRFDGDGYPHIGYYDEANGDLRYAHWDGTQWLTQTVDSEGDAGWYLSLALEPTAPYNPHLSYMDRESASLKYTYWDGAQWVFEVVDNPFAERVDILVLESDEPVVVGTTMHFTAVVTGSEPITYTWDFGGPGTAGGTETNPTFLYSETGSYSVTLMVENDFPSSDAQTIGVRVLPPEPVQILALDSDEPVVVGTTMHFTAVVTGSEPITYTWDFGGPGTAGGTDTHPTFLYSETGSYSVTLTVENDLPSSDTQTIGVRVLPPEPAQILALESDEPVRLGVTMHFTAVVTGSEPITYTWDFGGPGTAGGTDIRPTFLYSAAGVYSVTLTVENDLPSSDVQTIPVRVVYRIYLPLVMKE